MFELNVFCNNVVDEVMNDLRTVNRNEAAGCVGVRAVMFVADDNYIVLWNGLLIYVT